MRNLLGLTVRGSLICLLVLSAAPAVHADSSQEFGKFYLNFQGFVPLDLSTVLSVDAPGLPGNNPEFDLEDLLDLESNSDEYRLRGGYRFNRRNEVTFSLWSNERQREAVLNRTITVGDIVFNVGLDVESKFKTEDAEISYAYYFYQAPKGEMAFSVGVHAIRASFDIKGSAGTNLPGGDPVDFGGEVFEEVSLPLPVLGINGRAWFTKKLIFSGYLRALKADVAGYEGYFTDLEASLEHRTFKHLGFGVAYYSSSIDVEKDVLNDAAIANLRVDRQGLLAMIRVSI